MSLPFFQVAVIGGGINGAGIAREAAYRGYNCLLAEQGDFAGATSSQSSKLIHGGIRYLEQGRIGLVFEALHERKTLLAIAPHLVSPLRFHIPVYRGDSRAGWLIGLGCKLYDLLAGPHNLTASQRIRPQDFGQFPELAHEGLQAIFAYSDAQVFDARLTLETTLSAAQAGAVVRNYYRLVGAQPKGDRFLLEFLDLRTQTPEWAEAQVVINAAGAWTPRLDRWFTAKRKRPGLRFSRGIHLVIRAKGPHQHGFLTLPEGGRVVFVLPWAGNYTLIGTTESRYEGTDFAKIPPSEEEILYLLEVYRRYFPAQEIRRSEVLHIHSGVRSLIDRGESDLGQMSREYHIEGERLPGGQGYWAVFGGKITTYRSLGEKVMDQVGRGFPASAQAAKSTKHTPLPGALPLLPGQEQEARAAILGAGLDPSLESLWKSRYGNRWVEVAQGLRGNPRYQEQVLPQGLWLAELAYLVGSELAHLPEDVLLRRTLLGYETGPLELEKLQRALEELGALSGKSPQPRWP